VRIPDWAEFAEQVEELFGADGVAEVLDKERSGGLLAGVSCGFVRWREGWATCLFTSGARREFLLIAWLAVFLDGGLDWVDVGSDRNGVGGRRWASGVWRLSQDDARGELTTSSSGTRLLSGASGHVQIAISLKAAAASAQRVRASSNRSLSLEQYRGLLSAAEWKSSWHCNGDCCCLHR